ncbi:septal ring lytic transglycosylase RlpA family protein [Desulfovibrio litoralis]|uniref:Probable endolytic peptidoglycan transglycosylase RlpA n=1 Tax=Desulfovibrio litoralis DSM 11393 TaxID=1121455 RepID=A0A1M7RVH7_9BACT|nr:septal ring lytic transglycosylase RlpA family protein [Desulfovibrio litoralis]SHN50357.1 rare lipoprotein A [Desulfovibrio litoralis DSM 11393]
MINQKILYKLFFCLLLVSLSFSFSGCSWFKSSPSSDYSGGTSKGGKKQRGTKPYTIKGKTYYPLTSAHNYSEEGVASWYGPGFHGKQTANGEKYDMHTMTAAHKILPFDTRLKVTHLGNGKQITVRVNDRGPFVSNRIIDLSNVAAKQLGIVGTGTAKVRIESIGGVKGMDDSGDLRGKFYVQIGAFSLKQNAINLSTKLKQQGLTNRYVYADSISMWRVQIGPYPTLHSAERSRENLRSTHPYNFVVAD